MIAKKESIFFTITVTFIVSITLILISLFILYKNITHTERFFAHKQLMDMSRMVMREYRHNGETADLKNYLSQLNVGIISDFKKQEDFLHNPHLHLIFSQNFRNYMINHYQLDNKDIMYIKYHEHTLILIDYNKKTNHKLVMFSIFFVVILALVMLYIITIKKLLPLSELKEKVKDLANENFDVDCATTKNDEISQLANEFDKTAKHLKKIKESRNVFIRNIMHELKTPIAKGRFLVQLPQDEENSDKMTRVFDRLESLISEFAMIEELISSKKLLTKKEYFLEDVVDNSLDILMCDEDEVVKDFDNIKINIDFNLFSIAIKNLIDNGIKYSSNHQTIIKSQNKTIIFQSDGTQLKYPLEKYFEPFFKGDDVKSNQSFGLGLYIVKHILDAHNMQLDYLYQDGVNKFIISYS